VPNKKKYTQIPTTDDSIILQSLQVSKPCKQFQVNQFLSQDEDQLIMIYNFKQV